MEKDKLEGMMMDYIDGKLNDVDKKMVEQELMNNTESYKRYAQYKEVMFLMSRATLIEPSTKLKANFEKMLQEEIAAMPKQKVVFFKPVLMYRAAAVIALVIAGAGGGYYISRQQHERAERLAMQQQIDATRALILGKINNQQSASQRMVGVSAAYLETTPDKEIVTVLIKTMNEDSNTNVRLAAVEALGKFQQEPEIRKALISALSTQTDPLVQLALIQLMVEMKATEALKPMEKIIEDDNTLPAVKDEAYAGIIQLS